MKKKLVLGIIGVAMAALLAGCGVEQTATEITVEAGEELHVHANDFLDVDESKAHDVTINADGVDTSKVGEYELTATYGKDTYTLKVIVVDTTAPVLELASNEITVKTMAEFIPADVVTVTDASEYTVSVVGYEDVTQKTGEGTADAAASDVSLDGLVSDVPENDGTYRTVISVKDAYDNESLTEVYVTVDAQDEEAQVDDEKDSDKKDTSGKNDTSDKKDNSGKNNTSNKNDTSSKPSNNTSSSENTNSGSSNNNSGNSGNESNNSSGSAESTPEEESPSVDEEPAGMTPAQQEALEVGYYKVFIDPYGAYCVMVHDGRSEVSYARQLITDYLAAQGLRPTGGGGANMPGGNGWMYVVEAHEVAPLQ